MTTSYEITIEYTYRPREHASLRMDSAATLSNALLHTLKTWLPNVRHSDEYVHITRSLRGQEEQCLVFGVKMHTFKEMKIGPAIPLIEQDIRLKMKEWA